MENEKFTPEQVLNEAKKIVKEKELIHQEEMDEVDGKMPQQAYAVVNDTKRKLDLSQKKYQGDNFVKIDDIRENIDLDRIVKRN